MIDIELKPCPQCRNTKTNISKVKLGRSEWFVDKQYYVICENCNLSTDNFSTPKQAAKKWNNRPTEDFLLRKIARLELELEEECCWVCKHWKKESCYWTDSKDEYGWEKGAVCSNGFKRVSLNQYRDRKRRK